MGALAVPRAPAVEVRCETAMTFLRSLPDASVDVMATDPAYSSMNRHLALGRGRIVGQYSKRGQAGARWFSEIEDTPEYYGALLREMVRVMRPDRHLWIMVDPFTFGRIGCVFQAELDVKNVTVWVKRMGMGNNLRRSHEWIVLAMKGRRRIPDRRATDSWLTIPHVGRVHYPTQKPVALFAEMLRLSTVEPGMVVCDPFAGSGAAAVAAVYAGCGFVGCDTDPRAVAITRWRTTAAQAGGVDPLEGRGSGLPAHLRAWGSGTGAGGGT